MSAWGPGKKRRQLHRCARRGCSNEFESKMPWAKYCSNACRQAVQRERRQRRRGVPRRYGNRYGTCPRGHDRSEENTYVNPNTGRYACRVCRREDAKKKYDTNPEHRQQRIERERQRRAERRAA